MSARTILKHLHQQGRMTDYQFDVINRNLRERPKGKWIKDGEFYRCSECSSQELYPENFCYCCGADMRVKDELEERKNE